MGVKVRIKSTPTKVVVNAPPKDRIEINTHGGTGGGVENLAQLRDVDASSVDNNETVVYDEVSGKFVIKTIPIINGGTF